MDKNQAEILKYGLAIGFIDVKSIVDWSDNKISIGFEDSSLIEISSANSKNDIISLLGKIEGIPDQKIILEGILSIFDNYNRNNSNSYHLIIQLLFNLMQEFREIMDHDIEDKIYYLDDKYELASQNIFGTIDEFITELDIFLSKFRKYYLNVFK